MIHNYVPCPIPVYTSKTLQCFRKSSNCPAYANPVIFFASVATQPKIFLPRLAFNREYTGGADFLEFKLFDLNDNEIGSCNVAAHSPPLERGFRSASSNDEYENVYLDKQFVKFTTGSAFKEGHYYYRILSGSKYYYSESFYAYEVNSLTEQPPPDCGDDYIKIEWTGSTNVYAGVDSDGYTPYTAYTDKGDGIAVAGEYTFEPFFIYLKAVFSRPTWEVEEDGEKDASGVFTASSIRLEKRWTMEGEPVSEAVIDALQSIIVFDTVTVTDAAGTVFENVKRVKVDPSEELSGCLFSYKFSFTENYLLKQGC